MLEKDIERKVCEYAKLNNVDHYKFTSPNRAAVPDRMFISTSGRIWFCEFKREGQKPTPAQEREHLRMRSRGVTVYVIDNVDDGKAMIDKEAGLLGWFK